MTADPDAPNGEVLDLLLENARYTVEDVARMTGREESEVEAAISSLEEAGIVRGYRAVVDWDNTEREHVRAEVEVNVTLDRETSYTEIAERLARFPEVTDLRLVSGDYDFDMAVEGETMRDVSRFISEKVAPLPAVSQTVTHMVMETYKESSIYMGDDEDDDRLSVSP